MNNLFKTKLTLMFLFAFQGALITLWGIHIPVFSDQLDLSAPEIGFLLLVTGLGAIVASQIIGKYVDRFSSARGVLIGSVLTGAVSFLPPLMPTFEWLFAAMFCWGFALGAVDISMNAQAVEYERISGKRIFTFFHAFWSVGGGLGSLYGAGMLAIDAPLILTFGLIGGIWFVVPQLAKAWLIQKTTAQQAAENSAESSSTRKQPVRIMIGVLLLGLMGGAGALIEGIGIDWAALHQTRELGVDASRAALAVFVFSSAMAGFRFFADRVVEKLGRMFIIRWGSLVTGLGILIATSVATANLALTGWLVAGLGISAVVPQIFAISTDIGSPEHSGRNMAKVFGLTYAGLLGGPAIIGLIASLADLSLSLKIGALLAVSIWLLSLWIGNLQKSQARYSETTKV